MLINHTRILCSTNIIFSVFFPKRIKHTLAAGFYPKLPRTSFILDTQYHSFCFSSTKSIEESELVSPITIATEQPSKKLLKLPLEKRTSSLLKNSYKVVLNRVASTCEIYLKAPSLERAKAKEDSRFYYVKPILDNLDLKEQIDFLRYVHGRISFFKEDKTADSDRGLSEEGHSKLDTKEIIEGEQDNSTEKKQVVYNKSKTSVLKFLENPNYGPLLQELILEFLDEENPDFKWHIHEDLDEKYIGIIEKKSSSTSAKVAKLVLKRNLKLMRERIKKTSE